MSDKDDDYPDAVQAMADRLKLKGKERSQYVHEHMVRGGYKAIPNYVKAGEDEDEDKGSGFFGSGRRRKPRDDDDSW